MSHLLIDLLGAVVLGHLVTPDVNQSHEQEKTSAFFSFFFV